MNPQNKCGFTVSCNEYILKLATTHFNQEVIKQIFEATGADKTIFDLDYLNLTLSVYTDLFALKTMLIELLCSSLAFNQDPSNFRTNFQIIAAPHCDSDNNATNNRNFRQFAVKRTDSERLKFHLDNLINYANELKVKDNICPEVVIDVIKYFSPYLSVLNIKETNNLVEILKDEEILFRQCLDNIYNDFKLDDNFDSIKKQLNDYFENLDLFKTPSVKSNNSSSLNVFGVFAPEKEKSILEEQGANLIPTNSANQITSSI